jgi:magnesium transporter
MFRRIVSKRQQIKVRKLLGLRRARPSRVRPGAAPGTLVAPESHRGRPVRISRIMFSRDEVSEIEAKSVEECLDFPQQPGVVWINVEGLGQPDVIARIGERFGLHSLALEDVLDVHHRPKVEAYADHYFVVTRMVRLKRNAEWGMRDAELGGEPGSGWELEEEQVSIFFGPSFVITFQERADGDVFDPVRERIKHARGRIRSAGADYLAYSILDSLVDALFPALESLGERVEQLENEVIERPSHDVVTKVHALRRDLLGLRRNLWPLREALVVLQREESPFITPETRIFLRDCHDHAVQALELVETHRETAASLMEVYLSAQNQRLNEVMKVLTVMGTLFIPLTFIASIYGMNFQQMPELGWRYGYPAALGLMALVAGGLLAYFRRRGWW